MPEGAVFAVSESPAMNQPEPMSQNSERSNAILSANIAGHLDSEQDINRDPAEQETKK